MSGARLTLTLAIALTTLAACQPAPVLPPTSLTHQQGTLAVTASLATRKLQTVQTTYTAPNIHHTDFVLYLVDGVNVTLVTTQTLQGNPNGQRTTFSQLGAGLTYRIVANAYASAGSSQLIGDPVRSTVDLTATGGSQAVAVPVQLADTAFSGSTAGAIAITPGSYTYASAPPIAVSRQVSTLAGSPTQQAGFANDTANDGGTTAHFTSPEYVAVAADGTLYVSDAGNSCVRKVVPGGNTTVLAGVPLSPGTQNDVLNDGGTTAKFGAPTGIALDGLGHLYVADAFAGCIRQIELATGNTTTLAGTLFASQGYQDDTSNDGGALARFGGVNGLAADKLGHLYVEDGGNNCIRKIDLATGNTTTLAGSHAGSVGSSGDANDVLNDGGVSARFNGPRGLAVDAAGNVYVADTANKVIRKIDPATGNTTTFVGVNQLVSTVELIDDTLNDGGTTARFVFPIGLAFDGFDNLYMTDNGHTVRKIAPNGNTTTVAGDFNQHGYMDDGLNDLGVSARFDDLYGIGVDASGTLYTADQLDNNIRIIR